MVTVWLRSQQQARVLGAVTAQERRFQTDPFPSGELACLNEAGPSCAGSRSRT